VLVISKPTAGNPLPTMDIRYWRVDGEEGRDRRRNMAGLSRQARFGNREGERQTEGCVPPGYHLGLAGYHEAAPVRQEHGRRSRCGKRASHHHRRAPKLLTHTEGETEREKGRLGRLNSISGPRHLSLADVTVQMPLRAYCAARIDEKPLTAIEGQVLSIS
jgi:hypothetical protein